MNLKKPLKIESDVVAVFHKVLKQLGGGHWKFKSPGCSGVPDDVCVLEGFVFFVEFKRPDGKPRKLQQRVISELRDLGATVLVVDTCDAECVRDLLKRMLLNARFCT